MRNIQSLNQNWRFTRGGTKNAKPPKRPKRSWDTVDLPHTWNNLDGQDGGSNFWRGAAWYWKQLRLSLADGEQAYLEFKGVSMRAAVYVNGRAAGSHTGGFSTFRVNITPFLKRGKATVAICVDNSENDSVYPQTADFTFFGGIYRDVHLITVGRAHFDLDYFGTSGLAVTPVCKEDGSASVTAHAYLSNAEGCTVRFSMDGQTLEAKDEAVFLLEKPHLWNGLEDPYLYTMCAELLQNGQVVDRVTQRFGIRTFHVDPEKGFFLNGKPYPLRGVSRHQDRLDKGWAISKADHQEDMELIREVGANSIRLAHYQHAPYFYDLCDETGMVVWAEIPFISVFLPSQAARENTLTQMKELVLQNNNHPAVICWGIANEISIGETSDELLENLRALNTLCHTLDPTRPTTIASLSMVEPDSPLNFITDILAYNHYFGWYMGDVADNGPWLDDFHRQFPNTCLGLSEYGCEGNTLLHSDTPRVQDYSEEYQAYYHEQMLQTFSARPYLWCTYVWNMFDFASDMRDEGGVKGRNQKGLVTYDRKIKKDAFYIYKAWWSKTPFVHLCSSRFRDHAENSVTVKAYSNLPEVTLFVNGEEVARVKGEKIFLFPNITLREGENTIRAVAGDCADEMVWAKTGAPNPAYALQQETEADGGVKNWFADFQAEGELEFPDGYYSIQDKLGDIMKTPEGEALILNMIDLISEKMGMKISKGMMNMAKSMTIEKIFSMVGSRAPAQAKLYINQQLNQIKK